MGANSRSQGSDRLDRAIRDYMAKGLRIVPCLATLSCNSNWHGCDLGEVIKAAKQITAEAHRDLTRRLKHLATRISGGEPPLRKDIAALAKAVRQVLCRYRILASNGLLLNVTGHVQLHDNWPHKMPALR